MKTSSNLTRRAFTTGAAFAALSSVAGAYPVIPSTAKAIQDSLKVEIVSFQNSIVLVRFRNISEHELEIPHPLVWGFAGFTFTIQSLSKEVFGYVSGKGGKRPPRHVTADVPPAGDEIDRYLFVDFRQPFWEHTTKDRIKMKKPWKFDESLHHLKLTLNLSAWFDDSKAEISSPPGFHYSLCNWPEEGEKGN